MQKTSLICLLLLASGGCVDSGVPGTSANGEIGDSCTSVNGCEGGLLCYDGVCRQVCTGDENCPKSESCDNGVCLPVENGECAADAECTTPPRCQIIQGAECWGATCFYSFTAAGEDCNDGDTCTDFEECDGAGHCLGINVCCDDDGDCDHLDSTSCDAESCQGQTDDSTCNLQGMCENAIVNDDSHCAGQTTLCGDFANIVCTAGVNQSTQACPTTCAPGAVDDDALCDPGLVCTTGTCTVPVGAGECCHNASCGNADCTTDFHCGDTQSPAAYVCCADATSGPENLCCTDHDHCPGGDLCNAAFVCNTDCTGHGDEQCKDGWHCDGSECVEDLDNTFECLYDTDCSSENCAEDLDEPAVLVCATFGHCIDDTAEYEPPNGACLDIDTFKTCMGDGDWTSPAECTGETPLCDDQSGPAVCVACTEDVHCDDGVACTGVEQCDGGSCEPGNDLCTPDSGCVAAIDECGGCLADTDCATNLVPVMTAGALPSGTVTVSSTWTSPVTPGWHAFDRDTSTSWLGALRNPSAGYDGTDWIAYEFGALRGYVTHYNVTAANYNNANRSPSSWTLEGWNGSAWEVVDTVVGESGWGSVETRFYVVDDPGCYARYRMSISEIQHIQGDIVAMADLRLSGEMCVTPVMTAADAPSGTVTHSTRYDSRYPGWKAFDETSGTSWFSAVDGAVYPGDDWVQYQWPSPLGRFITHYRIEVANTGLEGRSPKSWRLEGMGASDWVTVDEVTADPTWAGSETRLYEVDSPGLYNQVRLFITEIQNPDNDIVGIAELEFLGDLSAIPEMTANDAPGGTVETSSIFSASYPGWRAFDSAIEPWISAVDGSTYPGDQWISYEWEDGLPRTVVRYQITCANYSLPRSPTAWKLEGWDGSWHTVDERGQTTLEPDWADIERRSFDVSTPGAYTKYRLWIDHIENDDGDVVDISYLELFTADATCNTTSHECEPL